VSNFPEIPKHLRIIDQTNWNEYYYIGPGDECLYVWERMSQVKSGDWNKYPTNGFISNLQIPIGCKTENPYRFKHKRPAINHAAKALGELLPELREVGTFVPVPPSKPKEDAEHDDRLVRVLKAVRPPLADIRELVLQREGWDAKEKGRRPEDRAQNYYINEDETHPEPRLILVFDDVLTTGSHFKALKLVLGERFPNARICGVFLARAVRPPQDEGFEIWE
jgi:hypothetical protein